MARNGTGESGCGIVPGTVTRARIAVGGSSVEARCPLAASTACDWFNAGTSPGANHLIVFLRASRRFVGVALEGSGRQRRLLVDFCRSR